MYKLIQTISIIFALIGTFLLAYGLKVKTGISNDLRKDLDIDKKRLIPPSDVVQRGTLVRWGLVLITIAAGLQLSVVLCP